jgi:excisionase family DNA binding protein
VRRADGRPDRRIEPLAVGVNDAGRMLGVSRRTVWTLLRDGALPRSFSIGSRRLIPVEDLERFVQERAGAARPSSLDGATESQDDFRARVGGAGVEVTKTLPTDGGT